MKVPRCPENIEKFCEEKQSKSSIEAKKAIYFSFKSLKKQLIKEIKYFMKYGKFNNLVTRYVTVFQSIKVSSPVAGDIIQTFHQLKDSGDLMKEFKDFTEAGWTLKIRIKAEDCMHNNEFTVCATLDTL